jgi:hypothetical protein
MLVANSTLAPKDLARKNVRRWSPLFDLRDHGFDVMKDTPVEIMHNTDLGLTRQFLFRLTTTGGEEAKLFQKALDDLIATVKGVAEMGRRPRPLAELPNFKASELQFICLCLFPVYFGCLLTFDSITTDDETFRCVFIIFMILSCSYQTISCRMIKECGLRYAFLTRMQYFADDVIASINDLVDVKQLFKDFYKCFDECMNRGTKDSVTYNLHAFYHSMDQRKGEAWRFSAEPFESSYFVIKQLFSKGTNNRSKQILLKYYMRDFIRHSCHLNQKMTVKTKTTVSQDNSIAIMEHNGQKMFVRIRKEEEDKRFLVSTICTSQFQAEEGLLQLPWHLIGVHKYECETEDTFHASLSDFSAKGVIVANTICELRLDWLQSQLQQ